MIGDTGKSFLDLPLELRNKIYRHVCSIHGIVRQPMRVEIKAPARAMFLTCRQISEEFIAIFYHDLILEFTEFRGLLDFIKRTDLFNRDRIRRLRYLHTHLDSTFRTIYLQVRQISSPLPSYEFLLCTRSTRKGEYKATLFELGKDLPETPAIFWVRQDGFRVPDSDPPKTLIRQFRTMTSSVPQSDQSLKRRLALRDRTEDNKAAAADLNASGSMTTLSL